MQNYKITFYKGPDDGGRRIRKITHVVRPCENPAMALAYAAQCLARTDAELLREVVEIKVQMTDEDATVLKVVA